MANKEIRLSHSRLKGGAITKIAVKDFNKSSAAYLDDFSVGPTLYPAVVRLTDQDCWMLYKGNEWILTCVDRLVNDCVKVQPRIVAKDDGNEPSGRAKKRIKIVEDFLNEPNNNKEPFFELREKVLRDMLVMGRGIYEKVLNPVTRFLQEMYAVSPEYVRIQSDQHGTLPDKNTYILRHWRKEVPVYFDRDEMVFMVHRPISKSAYGIRILDGICNTVATDILRATYNGNFFMNGAEAAGIIGLEGMNNKELGKFRTYWRENFRGAKNAHKTAAVNVPVKYVRMAITNRDLEFSQYGLELRTKIFAAFGIPPFILGIIDQNTGKLNSDQQMQLYKDGALKPILMKEAYYYTREIIKDGFGFDDIEFTFDAIDLLDFNNQATIDRQDVASGITTINEVRQQRGRKHVNWGNTPISVLPGGGQVHPTTGKLIPPSQTTGVGAKKPAGVGKTKTPRKKNLLGNYVDSMKIKLKAMLLKSPEGSNFIDIERGVKFDAVYKEKPYYFNGQKWTFKYYTLPQDFKKGKLYQFVEDMIVPTMVNKDSDTRHYYLEAIGTKVRHIVFENILKGNVLNIFIEIDKFVEEEKETGFYQEIF